MVGEVENEDGQQGTKEDHHIDHYALDNQLVGQFVEPRHAVENGHEDIREDKDDIKREQDPVGDVG
jgi:hypothetical protein